MKTPHVQLSDLLKITLLCFPLLLIPSLSYSRDIDFLWTANPEPVTSYNLYYKTDSNSDVPYDGTGANEGDSPIPVGKVTSFTVTGLSPNETYYFVLTAVNDTEESEFTSPPATYEPILMSSPTITIMSQN